MSNLMFSVNINQYSIGTWQKNASTDYHAATDQMTDDEKERYRQELLLKVGDAVKEELKGISPAARMKKVETYLVHLVCEKFAFQNET